jgi:hypothetical protein
MPHNNIVPISGVEIAPIRGVPAIPVDHYRAIFEPRQYPPLSAGEELQGDPDEDLRDEAFDMLGSWLAICGGAFCGVLVGGWMLARNLGWL